MLNSYLNLTSKTFFENLDDKATAVFFLILFTLMYLLWYIHSLCEKNFITKEKYRKLEKELRYSSRLYSLLEVLKNITEEQNHFIDLNLKNDLSNIHWDLVNLEYAMAQIIPAIENSLLSKKSISNEELQRALLSLKEGDTSNLSDSSFSEEALTSTNVEDDSSIKVLQDLEDRWRTIRSNLGLDSEKKAKKEKLNVYVNNIKNNTKSPRLPTPIREDSKIPLIDENNEKSLSSDTSNYALNLNKRPLIDIDEEILGPEYPEITVLKDKTKTFCDSESLFSIDMQSSSSLEKSVHNKRYI